MKHYIFLFALSILSCLTVFGQSAEDAYNKASNFYDKADYTSAIKNINKALQIDSVNTKYLLLKGNALEKAHKTQEAFDTYTLALKIDPKDVFAYNQRGLFLMKIQETEYSIQDFTTALSLAPADSVKLTLLVNRGAAKINIRNFQGAYDDFIVALSLDSMNIGTLNNLASVCDEVGKGDQTLFYLFKILKIDSTFIGAYGNIGFKYQEMGDYNKAIQYYNKVLELAPNEPLGFSNRAYNRYKLGDYKGALSDINLSIKFYPTNSYAFRIRALIYVAEKDTSKACLDIEQALSLGFTKMYGEEVDQLKKLYCK